MAMRAQADQALQCLARFRRSSRARLHNTPAHTAPERPSVLAGLSATRALTAYTSALKTSERTRAAVAQKIQTLLIDDIDGSAAEDTVRFGLDGTEYEIDLNAGHATELRNALARYMDAGRRVSASTRRPARSGRKPQPNALNTTEVREWAKAQGIDVKDRGRVPAELVVKFKAATGQ
jgi:hypothetical protein